MPALAVECPSGLVVTVREYQVNDEDLLTNPQSVRDGLVTVKLLTAITQSVEDPGPYHRHMKGDRLDWLAVLQGDSLDVMRRNRIATWGKEYPFRLPCPHCRQPVSEDVDLEELPVRPLPESSKKHVEDGTTPIYTVLPSCGVRVGFRLLRNRDEKGLATINKQHGSQRSSRYLRFRLMDVEGVKEPAWNEWVQGLSGRDSSFLRAAFDEHDCGVEQERDFNCTSCGHSWVQDVRFGTDFLFPKYRGSTMRTGS